MNTVNDFVDILRIIREQAEWGDALRGALLSKEELGLPQRLAEFAETTNRGLGTLERDVAELKAGQSRLEAGQARLEGAVGNLRGNACEERVVNNIATVVRRPLSIRRVSVVKGQGVTDNMAFHELMDAAEDQGIISGQERIEADTTDLVIQGERYPNQATVVALEISVTAADSDINRAAARSELLQSATGKESIPAVGSAHVDAVRQQLAEERKVTFISFGE